MDKFRIGLATAAFAILAAACGGAEASDARVDPDETSAREVRAVLTEANEIALEYGKAHLGHYLRLSTTKLTRAGLEVPAGIEISVATTHVSYCIKSRSTELPKSHAWAIATAGPEATLPSPVDKCAKGSY